jgi:hypothetical protein
MATPKDPMEYQKWKRKVSEGTRRAMIKKWEDSEYRKRVIEGIKRKWQDPDFKNKALTRLKEGRRKKLKERMKGEKNPAKRLEVRKKISEAMKGAKNPKWKGGITYQNDILRKISKGKLWRKAVFQRDNFTCQKCGQRGGRLVAHHIFNFADFPEYRYLVDNGITFCKKCHNEFHKKYGWGNNTKEQLEEFLSQGPSGSGVQLIRVRAP